MTNAIQSMKANCKNCYKCLRVCPVKSIRFSDGQAEIMSDFCIYCGACVSACPQEAKAVCSDLESVREMLRFHEQVVLTLAPSFLGSFELDDPRQLVGALKRLGFAQVRETARGAAMVSDELARIAAQGTMDNILTTCCPSAVQLVEKYYPDLTDSLSPVVSPMVAHGKAIKKELGQDVKVVFAGPCIAKIEEGKDVRYSGAIDGVLTFKDLIGWFQAAGIDPAQAEPQDFDEDLAGLAALYPVQAGILENVRARGIEGYDLLHVEGVEELQELLEAIRAGQLHHCFVEINACHGSCMGGPVTGVERGKRFKGAVHVKAYAQHQPVQVPKGMTMPVLATAYANRSQRQTLPTEEEIRAILRSIGKETPSDELNCASCGYPTCRAKAIAVYQGKAELSMCMPYMYQAAQSMSNVVLDNTPNVIVVVDEQLNVCELNTAAQQVFNATRAEAIGQPLDLYLDPSDFDFVLHNGQNVLDKKVSLPEYNMTCEETLVYLPRQHGVMAILRDISGEEAQERQLYQLRVDTMNMAQKVIDKQMVAAQEIASLLGETTAETKATLTRLKSMILSKGDDGHDSH
jgi:iron only hydrogenase large subunit-like protein/uncharacterized Fe-S cluster-containing protein